MLFSDRLSEVNSDPVFQKHRRERVASLLAGFAASFPTVTFRPELSFRIVNAQAVTTGAGREVKLYGGLAFHPKLGVHSLALVLLHEVGHHLSTGCRSPFDVTLACECEADHWSVTEGLDALNIAALRPFEIHKAIEQLEHVVSRETSAGDQMDKRWPRCWSARWPARKEALLKQIPCSGFCAT